MRTCFFFTGTTDYSVCESPQSSSYESESDPASDLEEDEGMNEISLSGEGKEARNIKCHGVHNNL